MLQIGLISDTHSFLDDSIFNYFEEVDEIWHAGDIGNIEIIHKLKEFKPLRAVFGNIDDAEMRWTLKEDEVFELEGLKIYLTHIGGLPPNFNPRTRKIIKEQNPDIFICGHSHIVNVKKDTKHNNMVCLNPGAAGKHGFHKIRTIMRFCLNQKKITNLELIELGTR
jgi:putative phosphoesterase